MVLMSAPVCVSVCLVPSLSHSTAVGQGLKWVTGLCLIDPPLGHWGDIPQFGSRGERLNVSFGSQAEEL